MSCFTLPNSRRDLIFSAIAGSSVVTIPPSPVVMTFVEKKLKPAATPNAPALIPLSAEP